MEDLLCTRVTHTQRDRYMSFYKPLSRVLKENSIGTPIILDVGCSYGIATKDLARYIRQYGILSYLVGIDPQLPPDAVQNLDVAIRGVGQHLSFKDNFFDIVIFENVISTPRDAREIRILLEIARVIQKNGFFCGDPIVEESPNINAEYIIPAHILKREMGERRKLNWRYVEQFVI